MTRYQMTRVLGLGSALIVLALVGGAMLHKEAAPPIRADDLRPHGERGPCSNCHQILPATTASGLTAGGTGWNTAPSGAWPGTPPTLPANYWSQAQSSARLPGTAVALQGPASAGALQVYPSTGVGSVLPAAFGAGVASATGPTPATPIAGRFAPPIVAGAVARHEWRGECRNCHTVMAAAAAPTQSAWQPTPPLPRPSPAAAADPPEAEALGMSVRQTRGAVAGVIVLESEGLARRSGLQLGDVIRAIDGQVTTDVSSFRRATRAADPANGIVVDTVRDGNAQVLVIR